MNAVSRLHATMMRDLKLMVRNRFLHAAAVVAGTMIGLLLLLPEALAQWLLPVVLLSNLLVNGYYFMAGMLMLELAERSLAVQFVTPLRAGEFVVAKLLVLVVLSCLESVVIVAVFGGVDYIKLLIGCSALTTMVAILGLLLVSRYRQISEFIMPSILVTLALLLGAVELLDLWHSNLLFVHPLYPPTLLLESAFREVSLEAMTMAAVLSAAWIAIGIAACRRVTLGLAAR